MVAVEPLTLLVHIAAGFVAMGAGAVALLTKKGGRRHRLAGRAFVCAMAVVAATAVTLYPLGPTDFRLFLVLVAVFSFYLAFSGYRVLSRKRPTDEPGPVDWAAVGLMVLAGIGMLAMGAVWALGNRTFAPVLLVFGVIATGFGGIDLRTFLATGDGRPAWMVTHLQRMIGAYIATVSAVSAVNLFVLPPVVRWLWPTAVGTPLIIWWSRKYS